MFAAALMVFTASLHPIENGIEFSDLSSDAVQRLSDCNVDEARFTSLMDLEHNDFDQDFEGGWRVVANVDGCERAAADLLIAYMEHSSHFDSERPGVIGWHAGQMLATAGETEQAIPYFEAKRTGAEDWILYVDATIAFLNRDRIAAETARAKLATMLPSEDLMAARRQFLVDHPNIDMPDGFVEQPQNLSVVDGFLKCWDHPYSVAYGGRCDD